MKIKLPLSHLRILPSVLGVAICLTGLLVYPRYTSDGIRTGLQLLTNNIIPSLFPFMVLSTYVVQSNATKYIATIIHKPSRFIWNVSGNGVIAVLLGLIGGYPVGAKTVAELCQDNQITHEEASRLMLWCVNPGPAFVITSVGTFMLGDTANGIIIYVSCVISSLFIGVFFRFFGTKTEAPLPKAVNTPNKNILIKSVSSGIDGMFNMCGWVLTFSALSGLLDASVSTEGLRYFMQIICEVTNGCRIGTSIPLSLPALSAVIGFGGFAVIAQVSPYLEKCGVKIKTFVCWRIIHSALSAFFCSQFIKLFPSSQQVFAVTGTKIVFSAPSYGWSTAIILVLMCLVLIFEVDNKRKVC